MHASSNAPIEICELYEKAPKIPAEIIAAAQLITEWAENNNFKNWRLNGIASREQLELIELWVKGQSFPHAG